ncbi:MAG TPA: hypothetical protein VK971_00585 [Thiohalobacter sp.]|nr:hypothetical protein [Thiohalobacter sp.]
MLQYPKLVSLSAVLGLILVGPLAAGEPVDKEDSVHSWGRWEVLAPAAGVPTVSSLPVESGVELRPGEAATLTPGFRTIDQAGAGGGSEPPAQGREPVVVPNPPGSEPPVGDPRPGFPRGGKPLVVPNAPAAPPPAGDPRARLRNT